jgi:hypothetical protein
MISSAIITPFAVFNREFLLVFEDMCCCVYRFIFIMLPLIISCPQFLIIGDAGAGKTALLKYFLERKCKWPWLVCRDDTLIIMLLLLLYPYVQLKRDLHTPSALNSVLKSSPLEASRFGYKSGTPPAKTDSALSRGITTEELLGVC